ncbi:MAG TPA: hypothetical protein DIT07_16300 [Sphingobacteriaceae bacterium]|nr:hypothetical protein [Sphingobacteriaceae bacterium]
MNIGLHIAEILEERGKVSVQEVGTFYLKKTDAYFDDERQLFFPSERKLSFKLFEEEEFNFAEYISKAEDISSVAAKHVIKQFAIKLNNALGTSGTAEIRGIGKLKKEGPEYVIETFTSYGLLPLPDSGSVSFETTDTVFPENNIVEKESYVDEEINIPEPVTPETVIPEEAPPKQEPVREEISIKEKSPVKEQVAPQKETALKEEVEEQEEFVTTDDDSLFSNSLLKWIIISFAVLLLAGSVLGYLFYPKIKVIIEKYRSALVQPAPAPVVPKPVIPAPVDSIADSILTKQTDSIVAAAKTGPATKTDSVKSGIITYEIIIASFAVKSEAETYVAQWTAKSAKVHLIEQSLGTFKYKVSAGSFTDQASAQNELSLVQKNINKEAWIDQVKN